MAHDIDARYSTYNGAGRDVHNHYSTSVQVLTSGPSSQTSASLSFNEAPTGLLSSHFTGREEELDYIGKVFQVVHGNAPSRCAIHAMPGLGKTQLILQYTEISYNRRRYSLIFWISSATTEKLNQG